MPSWIFLQNITSGIKNMIEFLQSSSSFQFIIALLVLVAVWGLFALRNEDLKEYFSGRTGKGILKGIVIVLGLAVVIALVSGCQGTYVNDASIYAGLDQTKKVSPMCEAGPDDRTTSNIGAPLTIFESDDSKFRANARYTHHSCAFNSDRNNYDAVGVELEYRVWER